MRSPAIKQAAILLILVLGGAAAAAAGNIPIIVTASSASDSVTIGLSESLTQNVANIAGIGWVNEIDVRVTGLGGTYLGTNRFRPPPASTTSRALGRSWAARRTFPPRPAASPKLFRRSTALATLLTPRRLSAGPPTPPGARSISTRCSRRSPWAGPGGMCVNSNFWETTSLTGGWYTTFQNCNIMATDPTPGGTWGVSGSPAVPTGYGFDNTLLAAFYVSPSTLCVAFGTTDGGPGAAPITGSSGSIMAAAGQTMSSLATFFLPRSLPGQCPATPTWTATSTLTT